MSGIVKIRPLTVRRKKIMPAFSVRTGIGNWDKPAASVYKKAPTLAQLRHAYETNPEIRKNIDRNLHEGEWTATFLRNGEVVERPRRVYYDKKRRIWRADGGVVHNVDLPDEGWVLQYDPVTGLPTKTGPREESREIFGKESYFWVRYTDLVAIKREYGRRGIMDSDGPFGISAVWTPDFSRDWIGSRIIQP